MRWRRCSAGLAGCLLIVWRRHFAVVSVRGNSMSPTLRDGQRLIMRRGRGADCRDIVVFLPPEEFMGSDIDVLVKRVIAVGGQPRPRELRHAGLADVVPLWHVAVMGDAPRSQGSGQFGYLPIQAILGRIVRLPWRSPEPGRLPAQDDLARVRAAVGHDLQSMRGKKKGRDKQSPIPSARNRFPPRYPGVPRNHGSP